MEPEENMTKDIENLINGINAITKKNRNEEFELNEEKNENTDELKSRINKNQEKPNHM